MNNKLQYVDDLLALTDEFNTFINEPLDRDENYHVRDYRHAAYRKWAKIDLGIRLLIDRLRKAEAKIEAMHEELADIARIAKERGDSHLFDAIDNDGMLYQSQYLAGLLAAAPDSTPTDSADSEGAK